MFLFWKGLFWRTRPAQVAGRSSTSTNRFGKLERRCHLKSSTEKKINQKWWWWGENKKETASITTYSVLRNTNGFSSIFYTTRGTKQLLLACSDSSFYFKSVRNLTILLSITYASFIKLHNHFKCCYLLNFTIISEWREKESGKNGS